MQIDHIICPVAIEEKLETKHHVSIQEARQSLLNEPRIRFVENGHQEGEDLYVAFGQTFSGRYVAVFFVYKPKTRTSIIVSARDMSKRERKAYGRKHK